MLGSFDNAQPKKEIGVKGTNPVPANIKASVDSGFNGYLKIPYSVAFLSGLRWWVYSHILSRMGVQKITLYVQEKFVLMVNA